jgi:hypothetical protein
VQCVVEPYTVVHNNSLSMMLDHFSVLMQHYNISGLQHMGDKVDFPPTGYTPIEQELDKGVTNNNYSHFRLTAKVMLGITMGP